MSPQDLDVVTAALAPFTDQGEFDLKAAVENPSLFEAFAAHLGPEARITFTGEGLMEGPFHGVEGFVAGWRQWVEPWEQFRVSVDELIDAGNGKVLLLTSNVARLEGGAEITQEGAAVYTVAGGMIIAADHYLDRDAARRALET